MAVASFGILICFLAILLSSDAFFLQSRRHHASSVPLSMSRYGLSGGYTTGRGRMSTSLAGKKGSRKYGPSSGYSAKSSASPVASSPAPTPAPAPATAPAPVVEAKKDPEPVVETKKEPEPVLEVKKEPEPVLEVKKEPEPVLEVKKEPEPVVETKKEPEPEPEPEPELSLEEQLRREVAQEFELRERRIGELSQLQSELSQSMRKKEEVEQVIRRELNALFPRLQEEFYKETARVDQLVGTATKFQEALEKKSTLADTEDITLGQMKDVRNKVSEPAILEQLDDAISKKQELIKIERAVCAEIKECIGALNSQIQDTRGKLASLNNAIMNLPSSEDMNKMREYTWDDVASLQETLYKSMDESKARDEVVAEFLYKFEDAMMQRGLVLGENTDLPPAVSAATGVRSSQIPKKEKGGKKQVKKIEVATPVQMAELMKTKSNDELGDSALEAIKKTFSALAKLSVNVFDAGKKFSNSDDAKVTGEMASKSVESLKATGANLQQALKLSSDTWNEVVKEDATSVDKVATDFIDGSKALVNSRDIRNALAGAGDGAKNTATQALDALKVVVGGVGEELQTNSVAVASAELQEALTELAAIVAVGSTRAAGAIQEQSRQLPPLRK